MAKLFSNYFSRNHIYLLNPCLQIVLMDAILIFMESFCLHLSSQNMIVALGLNYCLAMAIILSRLKRANSLYSAISFSHKVNEPYFDSYEFTKLSGNFCLLIMTSLVVEKYMPLASIWTTSVMCIVSILIIIRWNSREFLKRSVGIIRGFISLQTGNGVSFDEILVADVWTSFAKPISQLIGSNHMPLKLIFFS